MKPELVAAVRAGAVNLVEQLVEEMLRDARISSYNEGWADGWDDRVSCCG